jgi:predicted trehalose synthase
LGRAIGTLHGLPADDLEGLAAGPPEMPPLDSLRAIPALQWVHMSNATLETWRLLHQDTTLADALTSLRREEFAARVVPSHTDLRLDQVLLDDDRLHLTDWEEFRLADPARDVGSYVGEWLYRAMLRLMNKDGDRSWDHQTIMKRGAEELDAVRPLNVAFIAGYRASGSVLDDDTARRAVGFAGWHIFERLLAGSITKSRISAIELAAAGIGRSAVLNAADLVVTLGLKETA